MCGLVGVAQPGGAAGAELLRRIEAMSAAVEHRGPDATGVWHDEAAGVAFGHRRLSIIDLSEHGAQPMVSADSRWVLTYNGEIYNFPELAARLAARGVPLRGRSDTEVLLETIAHTSLTEALAVANGMFAFALWDRQERTLTLARDRLGEKPLYYAMAGRSLVFASEMSALRRHPGLDRDIDRRSLALFVRHSFVPGQHSIYEGVRRLPPGCLLTFRPGDDAPAEPTSYWSLHDVALAGAAGRTRRPTDHEVSSRVDEVASVLQDSVRTRMVSDVPIGCFLSGGLDSSLVAALMQEASTAPVRSFTVSVGGRGDEADHAAAVARHLGTEHLRIDLPASEALALATAAPSGYDEPFADPSAIPTMLLCAAARTHVTVALTGDGGDEIAAGYNRYLAAVGVVHRAASAPRWLREPLARSLLRIPPGRLDALLGRLPGSSRIPEPGTKAHKFAQLLSAGSGHRAYRALTTFVDPGDVLLAPGEHPSPAAAPEAWLDDLDPLHRMLYLDQVTTLPDDMLVKVDRASMRVSLECRVPLLDHRLVELLWRSPPELKMRTRETKWVFRRILNRYVPPELVDRPKQGFDPPLAEWLRGPLHEWMRDLLSPARLTTQGLFDGPAVSRLMNEHRSGARNHDYALWTLVTFQAWLDGQRGSVAAGPPARTVEA